MSNMYLLVILDKEIIPAIFKVFKFKTAMIQLFQITHYLFICFVLFFFYFERFGS